MSTEVATGVAVGVMVLANAVVGLSLLRIAIRTRRRPELLIGLGLFGMGPMSQGLTVIAGTGRLPCGEVNHALHALAAVGSGVGMACIYLFVLTVFRPGVAWARALTATAVLVLFVGERRLRRVADAGGARSAVEGRPPELGRRHPRRVHARVRLGRARVGQLLAARPQALRLGLIDATVTNRFLLWAVASGSAFLLGARLLQLPARRAAAHREPRAEPAHDGRLGRDGREHVSRVPAAAVVPRVGAAQGAERGEFSGSPAAPDLLWPPSFSTM